MDMENSAYLQKRSIQRLKDNLSRELRTLRAAHKRAEAYHKGGLLTKQKPLIVNGAIMRNLDDAVQWLEDARGALTEYLKGIKEQARAWEAAHGNSRAD